MNTNDSRLDRRRLAEKVAWEGGVFAALRYGIRSEEIADPQLRRLWARMERKYQAITPIAVEIAAALEKAA
jgi:hypothetical protein